VTYGGDSGNRIFVLYWRCLLIRVSVIRGSTLLTFTVFSLCTYLYCFVVILLFYVFYVL
jgi:hypothetical protein